MVGTEAGRLGAVWSHLLLCEAIAEERPAQFIDESGRPPLEAFEMDEMRLFGIGRVLRAALTAPELASAGFMDAFAGANELAPVLSYPQPCLQAMLVTPGGGMEFLVHVRDEAGAQRMMSLARRVGHGQRCLCVQVDSEDPMQAILADRARDRMGSRMVYLGCLQREGGDASDGIGALGARDGAGEIAWLEAPYRDDHERSRLLARLDAMRDHSRPVAPWWIGELRLRHPFPGAFGPQVCAGCLVVATGLQGATREWLTAMSTRLCDSYRDARLPDGSRGDISFAVAEGGPPGWPPEPDRPAYRRSRPGLQS